MKSLKHLTLILIFCISSLNAQNLTQTIRGVVIDEVTEAPLVGATVQLILPGVINASATDANGAFTLKGVPMGRQTIEIKYLGYNSRVVQNLLVEMGKETNITIRLAESTIEMDAVTVVADQKKAGTQNDMVMVSGRTFSKEETERFAGSLGDPARMVANYAGVVAGGDARNDIIIRGNSPTGVLWRLEGIEVPNPNHFGALGSTGGPVSMVNNNLLTNSDFITGAFPAEYSNAIGGVFDLNYKSGNSSKHEFLGQIGFNGFELGAEGPLVKTQSGQNASYLINARYSTLQVASNLGVDFGTGAAIPEYKDLSCVIDIPGTKLGRFKLFTLMGNSHIELGKSFEVDNESSYSTRGIRIDNSADVVVTGLTHTILTGKNSRLKSTLSYQTTGSEADLDSLRYQNQTYDPWVRSYQQEQKVSFSSNWRTKITSNNNLSIGVIADKIYTNYLDSIKQPNPGYFITTEDTKGDFFLLRGFAEWQHFFGEKAVSYLGVASTYFDLNKETLVEPRLGFRYNVTPKQSLNIGFGMHSQIQPRVIYYYQEFDTITGTYGGYTNKDVKMSRSAHVVLGYNMLLGPNFRVKAETYYQHLYKIPVKASFGEFSMLNFGDDFALPRQDSLINNGTGTNYGVEFTIEKFLSKGYYALLTTSIYNSFYKGYDGVERNTTFNGNYVVNLLAGYEYKLSEKYMITVDGKVVSAGGRKYVPFDLDKSFSTGEVSYDWTTAYENSYPNYFRMDLRLGFKMNGKKVSQEWAIDFQNLTNSQNLYREGIDIAQKEVYAINQTGFFPMFLYRIRF